MIHIIFILITIIGGAFGYSAFVDHFPEEQRGMGLLESASPVMEKITELNDMLLIMCFAISGFVMIMLGYICFRYNKKKNPKASTFTHNTKLEIIWTVIPVIILVALAIPSIKLLYYMDKTVDAEMTLKVVGYQWYWGYEYPESNIAFESYIIPDDEIKGDQIRLLEVDKRVVLPVDTNIRILLTSADVLHSWALPELGIKTDTVPGRLNETWVRITKEGTYRGQCSELCGVNHGFMPIVINAVSKQKFKQWAAKQPKN